MDKSVERCLHFGNVLEPERARMIAIITSMEDKYMPSFSLLSTGKGDPKAGKAAQAGCLEGIFRILPATTWGRILHMPGAQREIRRLCAEYGISKVDLEKTDRFNACVCAGFCQRACLHYCGRNNSAGMHEAIGEPFRSSITLGRFRRTFRLLFAQAGLYADLRRECVLLSKHAKEAGLIPVIRINGLSDLPNLAEKLAQDVQAEDPGIRFLDYTKIAMYSNTHPSEPRLSWYRSRVYRSYSVSEHAGSVAFAEKLLSQGHSVSVVGDRPWEPGMTWQGYPTTNGDAHDIRFADPAGTVAWLSPKGPAKLLPAGREGHWVQLPD